MQTKINLNSPAQMIASALVLVNSRLVEEGKLPEHHSEICPDCVTKALGMAFKHNVSDLADLSDEDFDQFAAGFEVIRGMMLNVLHYSQGALVAQEKLEEIGVDPVNFELDLEDFTVSVGGNKLTERNDFNLGAFMHKYAQDNASKVAEKMIGDLKKKIEETAEQEEAPSDTARVKLRVKNLKKPAEPDKTEDNDLPGEEVNVDDLPDVPESAAIKELIKALSSGGGQVQIRRLRL